MVVGEVTSVEEFQKRLHGCYRTVQVTIDNTGEYEQGTDPIYQLLMEELFYIVTKERDNLLAWRAAELFGGKHTTEWYIFLGTTTSLTDLDKKRWVVSNAIGPSVVRVLVHIRHWYGIGD